MARQLQEAVLTTIMGALDWPKLVEHKAYRHRLARRAEAFIMAHLDQPITIHDLCDAVGAAERTLYLGFRDHFGLSPIAYQRAIRLAGAYRDLRRPEVATTVTAIAMKWGFFHLGEFAGAYRRLFGEVPSQTLRAAWHPRRRRATSSTPGP